MRPSTTTSRLRLLLSGTDMTKYWLMTLLSYKYSNTYDVVFLVQLNSVFIGQNWLIKSYIFRLYPCQILTHIFFHNYHIVKDHIHVETDLFNKHTEYIMRVKHCQYLINRQDYVTRKTAKQMTTTLRGVITYASTYVRKGYIHYAS